MIEVIQTIANRERGMWKSVYSEKVVYAIDVKFVNSHAWYLQCACIMRKGKFISHMYFFSSGRKRRAVDDEYVVFTIGEEGECINRNADEYCNGYLQPGREYA